MSTKYFILSQQEDTVNQIIHTNCKKTFVLPVANFPHYLKDGLFEQSLINWTISLCNKVKDKVFLDIGSHTGTYGISLANHVKHVYCFEPQKMTYYALCGGVALSGHNNVTCLNVGLGNESQAGTQTLKIISNDGGGSSLHATSGILREEEITIKTLDSLNITNVGFIKMDVEDNELYVLQGAVDTLKQSGYPSILLEFNKQNDALNDFIKSLGYSITNISYYSNMFLAFKD